MRKIGRTPYGYNRRKGNLVKNLFEQSVIREMMKLRHNHHLSYNQIAEKLNENLIPSPAGACWWGDSVNQILKRCEDEIES